MSKSTITFDRFMDLDIRIATVTAVEVVPDADKLLKLTLDAGDLGERTVVSGIREWYSPEQLESTQVVYLANLEPRKVRGVESQGMILAADEGKAILLQAKDAVSPGTIVR